MQILSKISWSLADLLEGWAQVQASDANTVITGLSLDSRLTKTGDLFFAIQGLRRHGLEFCQQAVAHGAVAIAWEQGHEERRKKLPGFVPSIVVPSLRHKLGLIARRFYHNPSAHIGVIGVTGTDGKTSVSQFIAQVFNQLRISCGIIGTLGYGVYPNLKSSVHTTPDAICVQALLNHFVEEEISYTVIEASSHGLKQGRLNGVTVDTAVFTNLSRDHMDYHQSLKDYGSSKRILFQTPS